MIKNLKAKKIAKVATLLFIATIVFIMYYLGQLYMFGSYGQNRRLFYSQYIGTNGLIRVRAREAELTLALREYNNLASFDILEIEYILAKLYLINEDNIQTKIIAENIHISDAYGDVKIHYAFYIPVANLLYIGASLPSLNRRGVQLLNNYRFYVLIDDLLKPIIPLSVGNSEFLGRSFDIFQLRGFETESVNDIKIKLFMNDRFFSISPA